MRSGFLWPSWYSKGRLCHHKHTSGMITPPLHKRGKLQGSRANDKTEHLTDHVKETKSFPKRISHYSRQQSTKKYLSFDLNVSKMHDLYLQKYEPDTSQKIQNEKNANLRFCMSITNTFSILVSICHLEHPEPTFVVYVTG